LSKWAVIGVPSYTMLTNNPDKLVLPDFAMHNYIEDDLESRLEKHEKYNRIDEDERMFWY